MRTQLHWIAFGLSLIGAGCSFRLNQSEDAGGADLMMEMVQDLPKPTPPDMTDLSPPPPDMTAILPDQSYGGPGYTLLALSLDYKVRIMYMYDSEAHLRCSYFDSMTWQACSFADNKGGNKSEVLSYGSIIKIRFLSDNSLVIIHKVSDKSYSGIRFEFHNGDLWTIAFDANLISTRDGMLGGVTFSPDDKYVIYEKCNTPIGTYPCILAQKAVPQPITP